MSNRRVWSGVAVAVQSALASAITISGITLASPGVLTHGGSDPSNGDLVLLEVTGMNQVDQRVFRVAGQAAGSFQLEGEDTSNYDAFVSGTFKVITFGTSLGTVIGVSASGGEYSFEDMTTIHDRVAVQQPTIASAVVYNLENHWGPDDAGLIALRAASAVKGQRAIRLTFADGAISLFYGYVGAVGVPGGSAQGKVTEQVTLTASGLPTNYAS